jgi:hygromycin-B 7''-O-kinase
MDAVKFLAWSSTLAGYRQTFTDAGLWSPFIEWICRQHDWSCNLVRSGLAGTFPVFIVDDQRVVKFFGPLFEGEQCWRVEKEAARLLSDVPAVPLARLMASGVLDFEPAWKYLVFEYVPGLSIGEVYARVPFEEKLSLVRRLGDWLLRIHRIKIRDGKSLPCLSLDLARNWFSSRWPEGRANWPAQLGRQVKDYLNANGHFFQGGHENLIHADLTRDHILGKFQFGHWETMAVIDLGDAMLGNIYYELAALHLDLFDCDKRLLGAFLQVYGLSPDRNFVRKAMVTSLLHQFDVYAPMFAWKPEFQEMQTLEDLADHVWKIDDKIL